jgi:hypothetical protein
VFYLRFFEKAEPKAEPTPETTVTTPLLIADKNPPVFEPIALVDPVKLLCLIYINCYKSLKTF